eukprot:GHVU01078721.1.p1 GENE.GHVU01078721.1~~GHVU01078721.1.p1  ORF type:complete len:204 (-),score=24.89 GHVU01078721.1:187-798(-)
MNGISVFLLVSVWMCTLVDRPLAVGALRLRRPHVAKCTLTTGPGSSKTASPAGVGAVAGDGASSGELVFYVPVADKKLYESGVKTMAQSLAANREGATASSGSGAKAEGTNSSMANMVVNCEDTFESNLSCALCLYNEVSSDRQQMVQGQVVQVALTQCMQGNFKNSPRMKSSDFHPICYPPKPSQQQPQDKQSFQSPPAAAE